MNGDFGAEREVFAKRGDAFVQVDSASDADPHLRIIFGQDGMRFRLTYDGELKVAGNNNTRGPEKWAIRKALHPQLEELWAVHPVLRGEALGYRPAEPGESGSGPERLAKLLREPIVVGGTRFVPLVRAKFHLTCSLDILFLRKEGPGSLVSNSGDLDGRIKTLFDGLRMPSEAEMAIDRPHAEPFFCLLQDDALITEVSVRADRLLSRTDASRSEVRLIMDVVVKPSQIGIENQGFLGS